MVRISDRALFPARHRLHGSGVRRVAIPWRGSVEALLLVLVLSAIALAAYGSHMSQGGFIGDAWTTRAWYQLYSHDEFLASVRHFLDLSTMATRPLNAVYRVVLNDSFGGQMGLWFAWQAASCVLMSLTLFLLLRKLAFDSLDAGLIAILTLIFPAANSLRLWTPVIHASLAIALAGLGFLAALYAFESRGRRRVVLHGASLLLFVTSLLLYEVALPLMLASVLLYRIRVPWRPAIRRWLVDCGLLLPIALAVTRSPSSAAQDQDAGGALSHAVTIIEQCPTLLTTVLLPFGAVRWLAFGAFVLLPLIATLVARRLPVADPARALLRRWVTVFVAGWAIVALGYSIYVPGIDYYVPLAPGIADRVNAVSGIGWVLVLYGSIALVATLAFRRSARARVLTSTLVLLACAALGISWGKSIADEGTTYADAYREGQRTLAVIRAAIPDPRPGSTIWIFGQPVEISPGVPVFANTWDTTAAVSLMYRDPSILSYVGYPGTTFECRPNAIVPGNNSNYLPASPSDIKKFTSFYGSTYFVDTVGGQVEVIDGPERCRYASAAFGRSPWLPSE